MVDTAVTTHLATLSFIFGGATETLKYLAFESVIMPSQQFTGY